MRRACAVLLFAVPLVAPAASQQPPQPKPEDPLRVLPAALFGPQAAPGARGRYLESLALLRAALERAPCDVEALARAADLLDRFSRAHLLLDRARAALKRPEAAQPELRSRLGGLLGRLLVAKMRTLTRARVWVFQGGQVQVRPGGDEEAKKLALEAVPLLRGLLRVEPENARARRDLSLALERLDDKRFGAEIERLAKEAAALEEKTRPPHYAPVDLSVRAAALREQAQALEQVERNPNHDAALLLRKQALLLDFCTRTIEFEYEPALYGPVSLLAPRDMVMLELTRTFKATDGNVRTVAPLYYEPPTSQRLEIVRSLARDHSRGSSAVLLALIVRTESEDPLAEAAVEALAAGGPRFEPGELARLLRSALFDPEEEYSAWAQRLLARLAARLKLAETAPVLASVLRYDRDPWCPVRVATALACVGGPEHAGLLLARAADPALDVSFRREAVLALGRLAPERLNEVPDEPLLELALAGARYRLEPGEELRGRILAALDSEHESDDAARLCAALRLRESIPLLEKLIEAHPDHYAAETWKRALHEVSDTS